MFSDINLIIFLYSCHYINENMINEFISFNKVPETDKNENLHEREDFNHIHAMFVHILYILKILFQIHLPFLSAATTSMPPYYHI